MQSMSDTYLCKQCGAEYDAPGLCETCQIELVAEDEREEDTGFHEEDFSGTEDEENSFRYHHDDDEETKDLYGDDQGNY